MTEKEIPPPWPKNKRDWAALGTLADLVDEHIAEERERWIDEGDDPHAALLRQLSDGDKVTRDEARLLIDALSGKANATGRWVAVARHLQSGKASVKFVKLVGLLMEYNALAPAKAPTNSSKDPGELVDAEDLVLIPRILRRLYPKETGTMKENALGGWSSAVAAILRAPIDAEKRMRLSSDKDRHRLNDGKVRDLKKAASRPSFPLWVIGNYIERSLG